MPRRAHANACIAVVARGHHSGDQGPSGQARRVAPPSGGSKRRHDDVDVSHLSQKKHSLAARTCSPSARSRGNAGAGVLLGRSSTHIARQRLCVHTPTIGTHNDTHTAQDTTRTPALTTGTVHARILLTAFFSPHCIVQRAALCFSAGCVPSRELGLVYQVESCP